MRKFTDIQLSMLLSQHDHVGFSYDGSGKPYGPYDRQRDVREHMLYTSMPYDTTYEHRRFATTDEFLRALEERGLA